MKIVVKGCIARLPFGGHVWHHLQYVLGLRDLGHDVYFYEYAAPGEPFYYLGEGRESADPELGARALSGVMARHGLDGRWMLQAGGAAYGIPAEKALTMAAGAEAVIDLMGPYPGLPDSLAEAPVRLFIDTDPVFTQIRVAGGGEPAMERLRRYTHFATFAENVESLGALPDLGVDWIPTRQPIVMSEWPAAEEKPRGRFTTIMNWRGSNPPVWNGTRYGYKDEEMKRFLGLPKALGQNMEMCMSVDQRRIASENADLSGWTFAEAERATPDPDAYRAYIQNSKGEFAPAKNAYVRSNCGWFSERSACYLASGKPVAAQETGFSRVLPTGKGLFAVRDLDEAAEALREIDAAYSRHSAAAREIALAFFNAPDVLSSLLERCGSGGRV